jgi:hypothetical protein
MAMSMTMIMLNASRLPRHYGCTTNGARTSMRVCEMIDPDSLRLDPSLEINNDNHLEIHDLVPDMALLNDVSMRELMPVEASTALFNRYGEEEDPWEEDQIA